MFTSERTDHLFTFITRPRVQPMDVPGTPGTCHNVDLIRDVSIDLPNFGIEFCVRNFEIAKDA